MTADDRPLDGHAAAPTEDGDARPDAEVSRAEETEILIEEPAPEDRGEAETSLPSEIESLRGEIEGLRAERNALHAERDALYDRWLRAQAELENVRKRAERDRESWRLQAREAVVRELLPVLDNFDRALSALPPDAPRALLDGIGLIHRQMIDVLGRLGLSAMETAGQEFDPHLHEAVVTEVRTDVPHHTILGELQKGWLMGDRVLRPALVVVSLLPDNETGEPS